MKTIDLRDTTVLLAGRMRGLTQARARRELARRGAVVVSKLGAEVDLVFADAYQDRLVDQALELGIPVVQGADMRKILEQGAVLISDGPVEVDAAGLGRVIAELRGAFDGPPGAESWNHIVRWLDACDPALVDEAVAYVEGHVGQWDGREMGRWAPDEPVEQGAGASFVDVLPEDDVRVAPPHWVAEVLEREHSPKHRIARFWNTQGLAFNGSKLMRLLERDDLFELRGLYIGANASWSTAFVRKMLKSPVMRGLRRLAPGYVSVKDSMLFDDSVVEGLHTLVCNSAWGGISTELLTSHVADSVHTLRYAGGAPYRGLMLDLANQQECLPSLRTLSWTLEGSNLALGLVVQSGVFSRLERFRFHDVEMSAAHLQMILVDGRIDLLEELDLSPLPGAPGPSVAAMERWLVRLATTAHRLAGLRTLRLGAYATEEVRGALARYPELEVL